MFIENIFKTLSKSDKREFLLFLDRKKRKANRKDIQVCEALMQNKVPKIENNNNYHAIRNRIKKELIIFIFLKQIENDVTGESELLNEINLCRFLFNNQLEKQGWSYLNKTLKKAEDAQNHSVLYTIYLLMLAFSHTNTELDVYAIIDKKNKLKAYLDREEKLTDTLAIARYKLNNFRINTQEQSLTNLIDSIKKDIDVNHPSFYLHPKQVCNYLELIRGSLLYNRDIRPLAPIAEELYIKTKESNGFSKYTTEYKLRILYILSHALYRNQKLEKSFAYLQEMEDTLEKVNNRSFNHYYAKIVALKSSIYFLKGELNNASKVIEEFLESETTIALKDELNLKLNLLTYYSYNKEYKKANRFFIQMHHSDGWYRRIMGQEWVFKKNAIEMLLQFEMGKDDIALNRINSIIKNNKELVQLPQYKDIILFLKLFKKYIEDPSQVSKEDLLKVSSNQSIVSVDKEIKKTAFYSWFLAKVKERSPYDELMDNIANIRI